MKTHEYWVRMYLFAAGIATMLLIGVNLFKGLALDDVLAQSFGWGLFSALVYTGARWRQMRKQAACALCRE
ncbi:MAG TPA: hypothetical protein VFF16_13640 [Telluria sp.]|nr:hypothetical protein [Telluria sp.]